MMKVLITGVSGYLGSRLAKSLRTKGFYIIGLSKTRNKDLLDNDNFVNEWHKFDARNNEDYRIFSETNPDVIIHLISLDHKTSEIDHSLSRIINFDTSCKLLKAIESSKSLKKIIYISTIHVYRDQYLKEVAEDNEIAPKNMYALTHYLSEIAFNYFGDQTDVECINLRLSNSYGEPAIPNGKCWDLVINNLCRSAIRDKKIVLQSSGLQCRDFIHYETVCDAIEKIISINNTGNHNKTYNLCSGSSISLIDLAEKIRLIYKFIKREDIDILVNSNQIYDCNYEQKDHRSIKKVIYNNDKIKKLIELEEFDINDGLERLLHYL